MRPELRRALLVAAAGALVAAATASAAGSPAKTLASIVAAARAEQSFHYTSTGTYGTTSLHFDGEAGTNAGIQQITFHKGKQTGHVTVLVIADTAYIKGDQFVLINYMGYAAAAAEKYSGAWIVIPHTDQDYATVAAGVRVSSAVDEIVLQGQLASVASTKIDGLSVLGVRGTKTAAGATTVGTLYARATGAPLPVEQVMLQGKQKFVATFDKWNEPLHLTAPKGAIQISVVRSTSPGLVA